MSGISRRDFSVMHGRPLRSILCGMFLVNFVSVVPLASTQEEIQKMISDVDDDGSGTIGYEEQPC